MFTIRTGFIGSLAKGASVRITTTLSGGNTFKGDAKAVWLQTHPIEFVEGSPDLPASAELIVFNHGKKHTFDPTINVDVYSYKVTTQNLGPDAIGFDLDIAAFE